ncbi:hypothetical protein ACH4ZX_06125 [Streptomyces sp. NPDC020490]|uniref:hypothetical protein n=1 Tax=Streptomyces sp. NPDC020490 TaxID=3365078 RepID=UPI00379DBBC1
MLDRCRADPPVAEPRCGLDRDAGVKGLDDRRRRERYLGPAVSFSSRVSMSREALLHRQVDDTLGAAGSPSARRES